MITLKNDNGLEAHFNPDMGMTLMSFKKNGIEVIDQSTKGDFEERRAGLGPLIGPHFHKVQGLPYTHGVARHTKWSAEQNGQKVIAKLCGDDTYDNTLLKDLEKQDFKMTFTIEMTQSSLNLNLTVVSDFDSVVGIHYYYALPNGKGTVTSQVKNHYIINNELKPLPETWDFNDQNILTYPLNQDTDFTFHSYPNPLNGEIILDTETHQLITKTHCHSEENSFQLWHPKGASFVCIEPVSSQDPRRPNLSVSEIGIQLNIEKKF